MTALLIALLLIALIQALAIVLLAGRCRQSRNGQGHQPNVPPADWTITPPPTTSAIQRPRPTTRVVRRDEPCGHQPSGRAVDWSQVDTTGIRSALLPGYPPDTFGQRRGGQ